jgi:hypothetical protein
MNTGTIYQNSKTIINDAVKKVQQHPPKDHEDDEKTAAKPNPEAEAAATEAMECIYQ